VGRQLIVLSVFDLLTSAGNVGNYPFSGILQSRNLRHKIVYILVEHHLVSSYHILSCVSVEMIMGWRNCIILVCTLFNELELGDLKYDTKRFICF